MNYNFAKAEQNFWEKAPGILSENPFRPKHATIFSYLMFIARTSNISRIESSYDDVHHYTRISREEYHTTLNWLHEFGFIDYEPGKNRHIKGCISLKLEEILPTGNTVTEGYARGVATGYAKGYADGLLEIETLARTYAWPRGKGLTTGVEDSRVIESNNNPNQTNKGGSGENNGLVGSAGEEEECDDCPTVTFPSLQNLVDRFKTDHPNYYPESFLEEFVDYYIQPSDVVRGKQRWQLKMDVDRQLHISRLLKKSWENFGVKDYPNWTPGLSEKERRHQELMNFNGI